jgi:glucosamine 6-phosphate synthetase-like amidotransferase/phosphosugar isomerase protein
MWPVAMEGALKLKEISYIHAEAYAAGELKHGPLALIDENMPVVVVAPNNELLDKLKSNMQVVRARGGQLYVFADHETGIEAEDGIKVIEMPHADRLIAPIVYTVPLQLLAYHVAVLKGTDVDRRVISRSRSLSNRRSGSRACLFTINSVDSRLNVSHFCYKSRWRERLGQKQVRIGHR